MNYLVLNRRAIEKLHCVVDEHIIISITDERSKDANIPKNKSCKDILRLQFTDVEEDMYCDTIKYHSIEPRQAGAIASFVHKYIKDVDLVVVHCEAGISRSAGCAMAIEEWYEKKSVGNKYPLANRKVYRLVYEALMGRSNNE